MVAAYVHADLHQDIDADAKAVAPKVIEWRRDIHQHPELSNRETRTAALVAAHLKSLGLDVKTGVAHNGVVALLKGGKPGKTVALRADSCRSSRRPVCRTRRP